MLHRRALPLLLLLSLAVAGCPSPTVAPIDASGADALTGAPDAVVGRDVAPIDRDATAEPDAGLDATANDDAAPGADTQDAPDAGGPVSSLLISASGNLYVTSRDPASGSFGTQGGDVVGNINPQGTTGVAVRPDSRFVYGAQNAAPNPCQIMTYGVDVAAVRLEYVDADLGTPGPDGAPAGDIVNALTIDPSGTWLVAPARLGAPAISIFRISGGDGLPVPVAPVQLTGGPVEVVFAPDGTHAYAPLYDTGRIAVLDFDAASGAMTLVSSVRAREAFAIAMHPTLNILYSVGFTPPSVGVFDVAAGTGMLTRTATLTLSEAFSLAVSPDGQNVYASNGDGIARFDVDAVTGALTAREVVPLSSGNGNYRFAFDRAGRFLYVNTQGTVAVFARAADGALTEVESEGFGFLSGQLLVVE